MTCSRVQIPKGNMPDLPKGIKREYTSNIASNPKLKKDKTVKHYVTGLSKSTSTTMAVPCVQKTSLCETSGNVNEQQSTDDQTVCILAVPILQSPLPTGPCAISVTSPVGLATDTTNVTIPSSNIAGTPINTGTTAATACTASVIQPSSQTRTPQPPSQPGSALLKGCPWLVLMTCPPSCAAIPILGTKSNYPVISGPSVVTKLMSQPHQLESASASPDLLCSSQNTGSTPEQINVSSQVSNTSEIYGMTLK